MISVSETSFSGVTSARMKSNASLDGDRFVVIDEKDARSKSKTKSAPDG
ncbi:MAG: hypothetical protein ISS15_06875 [Alphaproteobacteria bacterium]|nr:hypothetical protein [Alphaproteobacteria bacterium]MBL7097361.1 hypothetical protein [Alphaproteobacteria bacterium]